MHRLLECLDAGQTEIDGWQVQPLTGGANNRLYRATGEPGDYVVKFMIKDARRRAEREYNALKVLHDAGLHLAPQPVLLDMDGYSLPVVVQTWVDGEVGMWESEEQWEALVQYFAALHRIPYHQIAGLHKPVVYIESPAQCREVIHERFDRLPADALPESLLDLVARFDSQSLPAWETPAFALTRTDSNPRNFIWCGQWLSVDWEYSGVTDPAFDLGDLIAHAAYIDVPRERWEWLIERYCALMDDGACEQRIRVYWRTMAIWWAVRFRQYLYEIPRGLDVRLAEPEAGWELQAERKYKHYLTIANTLLDEEK